MFRIGGAPVFLVLRSDAGSRRRRVGLVSSFPAALKDWDQTTRVSPVWVIDRDPLGETVTASPTTAAEWAFLGPVNPARVLAEVPFNGEIWASIGIYNLILRGTHAQIDGVLKWAVRARIPYEHWEVSNEVLRKTNWFSPTQVDVAPILRRVSRVASRRLQGSLAILRDEYCALMSSAISRAAVYSIALTAKLIALQGSVEDVLDRRKRLAELESADKPKTLPYLDVQDTFTWINAALSRLASQAFSGTSPIESTECHFWTHSLLGIGSANLALSNLVSQLEETIGRADIPGRLEQLARDSSNVPTRDQLTSGASPAHDLLGKIEPNSSPDDPYVPLVSYFSGRDGYSSHVHTISAPTTAVAAPNSIFYSLLTITHELSHVYIDSILTVIYPNPDNDDEIGDAIKYLDLDFRAKNWLEAARQLLVEAVVSIEEKELTGTPTIDKAFLAKALRRRRKEAKEILVHTFDFLYFYADKPESYISSIWYTWSTVPRIGDRVELYILRTLSAISATMLEETAERRLEISLGKLNASLEALEPQVASLSRYVTLALGNIRDYKRAGQARSRLKQRLGARFLLVRLVAIFLFSEEIAAGVFREPVASFGEKKVMPLLDDLPLSNPLVFLRAHLRSSPRLRDSVWILHNLAFNLTTKGDLQ